jgi:hypothetical protein
MPVVMVFIKIHLYSNMFNKIFVLKLTYYLCSPSCQSVCNKYLPKRGLGIKEHELNKIHPAPLLTKERGGRALWMEHHWMVRCAV